MFAVNIYFDPPTAEAIRQMRDKDSVEESVAFKVLMYTPIPGVDFLAALATYAVEETVFGKDLRARNGAARMDWSESSVTRSYVDKVIAQNRELIGVEVDALKRHLSVERTARAAASVAADVVMAKGKDALNGAASAAGDALASGIKSFFASNTKS